MHSSGDRKLLSVFIKNVNLKIKVAPTDSLLYTSLVLPLNTSVVVHRKWVMG